MSENGEARTSVENEPGEVKCASEFESPWEALVGDDAIGAGSESVEEFHTWVEH